MEAELEPKSRNWERSWEPQIWKRSRFLGSHAISLMAPLVFGSLASALLCSLIFGNHKLEPKMAGSPGFSNIQQYSTTANVSVHEKVDLCRENFNFELLVDLNVESGIL